MTCSATALVILSMEIQGRAERYMNKDMVNLTVEEMNRKVRRLRPDDLVEIRTEPGGMPVKAYVVRIYKNIVQFKKTDGSVFTTDYFTAMQANVIKPSGFESRSKEMAMRDFADAVRNSGTK